MIDIQLCLGLVSVISGMWLRFEYFEEGRHRTLMELLEGRVVSNVFLYTSGFLLEITLLILAILVHHDLNKMLDAGESFEKIA